MKTANLATRIKAGLLVGSAILLPQQAFAQDAVDGDDGALREAGDN